MGNGEEGTDWAALADDYDEANGKGMLTFCQLRPRGVGNGLGSTPRAKPLMLRSSIAIRPKRLTRSREILCR